MLNMAFPHESVVLVMPQNKQSNSDSLYSMTTVVVYLHIP